MSILAIIFAVQSIGVVLIELFGERIGFSFTGIVGGLISSTVITQVFAFRSKKSRLKDEDKSYASVSVLANGFSLLEKIAIVGVTNLDFLPVMLPFLITHLFVGVVVGFLQMDQAYKAKTSTKFNGSYFSIYPTIWFMSIFLIVTISNRIIPVVFSEHSDVITAGVSLVGGLDVTIIEVSKRAIEDFNMFFSINMIVLAFLINVGGKIVFSFFMGTKEFFKHVTIGLSITQISSMVVQYVLYFLFLIA
jgi:uncharacterized membrane protein (DUF4010 family)